MPGLTAQYAVDRVMEKRTVVLPYVVEAEVGGSCPACNPRGRPRSWAYLAVSMTWKCQNSSMALVGTLSRVEQAIFSSRNWRWATHSNDLFIAWRALSTCLGFRLPSTVEMCSSLVPTRIARSRSSIWWRSRVIAEWRSS